MPSVQSVLILGLVTKLLSKKDPEYHTSEAKAALMKEVKKLVDGEVWDERALSKKATAQKHANAVYSRLFPIVGIKNYDTRTNVQGARCNSRIQHEGRGW